MIADVEGVELRDCPFCGNAATLRKTSWGKGEPEGVLGVQFWAKCSNPNCAVSTMAMSKHVDAVNAWNTRS